jgi:NAD(P)-dependent dehydrogenase (short-subunit alcohol dehydrogenase family)
MDQNPVPGASVVGQSIGFAIAKIVGINEPALLRRTSSCLTYSTSVKKSSSLPGIPQRRVGAKSNLGGAILLLASGASRYMTGSVVTVDGGFLLN